MDFTFILSVIWNYDDLQLHYDFVGTLITLLYILINNNNVIFKTSRLQNEW